MTVLLDWKVIEIQKLDRGYVVKMDTRASREYANTPSEKLAFSTAEEVAIWLESRGIRSHPPGKIFY